MKNWDEQAEKIMIERFGKDTVIALNCTCHAWILFALEKNRKRGLVRQLGEVGCILSKQKKNR